MAWMLRVELHARDAVSRVLIVFCGFAARRKKAGRLCPLFADVILRPSGAKSTTAFQLVRFLQSQLSLPCSNLLLRADLGLLVFSVQLRPLLMWCCLTVCSWSFRSPAGPARMSREVSISLGV
jgi:hypothetical protein